MTALTNVSQQLQVLQCDVYEIVNKFLQQFTSLNTRKAYGNDVGSFLSFCLENNLPIQDVRQHHVMEFLTKILDQNTKNRKIAALKAFFRWAKVNCFLDKNPLEDVKAKSQPPTTPTEAFTDEEVRQILSIDVEDQNKAITLRLLFLLGLRRSEITNLKVSDLQTARGHVILNVVGKGNKLRQLPLNEELYKLLTNHIQANKLSENHYLIGTEKSKHERKVDESFIYRLVVQCASIIGVNRRLSPHSCRATAISHLLEKAVPIRDVAIFAGHSSTNTTQIYDKKRDAIVNSAAKHVNY